MPPSGFRPFDSVFGELYFAWVQADQMFGNTSPAWADAFDSLTRLCECVPERIQGVLAGADGDLFSFLLADGRLVPAGISLGRHEQPRSVFRLATSVYRRFLQDGVRDDPRYKVSPDTHASRRTCDVVCELIRQSTNGGGRWTWDFFDPSRELSGEHGYFWVFDRRELELYLNQSPHANISGFHARDYAAECFGAVGRPTVAPPADPDNDPAFDYVIRMDLKPVVSANVAHCYSVPALWDGHGWPFFLPSGDRDSRSGRTANVPIYNGVPVEGVREWVHPGVRLGDCLERMEPIGPVRRLSHPPDPRPGEAGELLAGALLAILRQRMNSATAA